MLSAGLLMYNLKDENNIQILLAHPGGPYFTNKDKGIWTIPKGIPNENEDLLQAAVREFEEETGIKPEGPYIPLDSIVQKGGKEVYAWAFMNTNDVILQPKSNFFEIEWPPKSGKQAKFPEVDKVAFFDPIEAKTRLIPAQSSFIDRLLEVLRINASS